MVLAPCLSTHSRPFIFRVSFQSHLINNLRAMILTNCLFTGWERTGQMLCIVDTSLSVLMTLRVCLRELCCVFTVWI